MKVPLLDLKAQYKQIKADVDKAVSEVFESQLFINGPQVKDCERAIASYSRSNFATGVSSGTDALLLSLMVDGIGRGDEVITSDYSFFASAGCISRTGAKPVFVDIDPRTYNIDPDAIESSITKNTRAILPVHLYGQMCDMDAIMEIAQRHNMVVIEDAAQAIGAENRGVRAGAVGHYGCFSFFPSKNLGCAGDGGIVVTNDKNRDERLKIFRNHGSNPKYYHRFIGGNFRLDTVQAAVILAKLPHLDDWSIARNNNADRYNLLFTEHDLIGNGVKSLPEIVTDRHIFNQYIIRVDRRDDLLTYLKERSVGCEIYYPVPFHLQQCFAYLGYNPGDFPHSEAAAKETLAIPIYPELSDEQVEYVVDCISDFYRKPSH